MTAEARKPRRKPFWNWKTAVGALFLCLAPSIVFVREKPGLLEQSTLAADIHDSWIAPYHWLSDHQIIFSRWGAQSGLYSYDTRTRKERFLGPLSRELEKANFPLCLDSLRVSPDGTRLLWDEPGDETVHGAWLDGSHYFSCVPRRYPGSASFTEVRWASDSRHWAAFVSDRRGTTQAMVYDGDALHKPTTIATAASDKGDPLETMGLISTQSLVLHNHILSCEWTGNQSVTSSVDVVDIALGTPTVRPKTRQINLPTDATIQEMVLSPQGDRIAWYLTLQAVPPWERYLHRLLPRYPVHGQPIESLWVSEVDGTQMHEIGSRTLKREEGFGPQLSQLEWVPGGKRLSYRYYMSVIYTVAAK